MDIICELIEKIRIRPEIYLGERSIVKLNAFLNGYLLREMECTNYNNSFLCGFQNYVAAYYNIRTSQGWSQIIRFFANSEEDAFNLFLERYDEFKRQGDGSSV